MGNGPALHVPAQKYAPGPAGCGGEPSQHSFVPPTSTCPVSPGIVQHSHSFGFPDGKHPLRPPAMQIACGLVSHCSLPSTTPLPQTGPGAVVVVVFDGSDATS